MHEFFNDEIEQCSDSPEIISALLQLIKSNLIFPQLVELWLSYSKKITFRHFPDTLVNNFFSVVNEAMLTSEAVGTNVAVVRSDAIGTKERC